MSFTAFDRREIGPRGGFGRDRKVRPEDLMRRRHVQSPARSRSPARSAPALEIRLDHPVKIASRRIGDLVTSFANPALTSAFVSVSRIVTLRWSTVFSGVLAGTKTPNHSWLPAQQIRLLDGRHVSKQSGSLWPGRHQRRRFPDLPYQGIVDGKDGGGNLASRKF